MHAKNFSTTPYHARLATHHATALGILSVLLVGACAAEAPAGLHSPGASRGDVTSSATTLGRASSFADRKSVV